MGLRVPLILLLLTASSALWCAEAEAAPPATRILKESRSFLGAVRQVDARIRLQRSDGRRSPLLRGLHLGLKHQLGVDEGLASDDEVSLNPEPPPGKEATLQIQRDKGLTLTPLAEPGGASTLDLQARGDDLAPEMQLLALALATTNLERGFKRSLDIKLAKKVMTIDRIDGRLVWAIGDEAASVWIDRQVYRPARIWFAPDILGPDTWAAKMTYGDSEPGRGWFPHRVAISKNDRVVLIVHVLEASLSR